MNTSTWQNKGDVNFFEMGRLVRKDGETEFTILCCDPVPDDDTLFAFGDCYVDISDSFINKDDVMLFDGMSDDTYNDVDFAIACIDYYGAWQFTEYDSTKYMTHDEVLRELKAYNIPLKEFNIS